MSREEEMMMEKKCKWIVLWDFTEDGWDEGLGR